MGFSMKDAAEAMSQVTNHDIQQVTRWVGDQETHKRLTIDEEMFLQGALAAYVHTIKPLYDKHKTDLHVVTSKINSIDKGES